MRRCGFSDHINCMRTEPFNLLGIALPRLILHIIHRPGMVDLVLTKSIPVIDDHGQSQTLFPNYEHHKAVVFLFTHVYLQDFLDSSSRVGKRNQTSYVAM